jgi:hypothetical protein
MSRARPADDPPPLDPYGDNPHADDSEFGLPENYSDPTQYRAIPPAPRETMGFGEGI